MIPFNEIETYLINISKGGPSDRLEEYQNTLFSEKAQLEYNSSRFIDDFGHKLDEDAFDEYHRFIKVQNENYAKITRIERIMSAYV